MENYNLQLIHHFNGFNLKSDLLRGIYSYGYERPSDVQSEAVLPILQGFDVIAKAQSGTGKSASFIIPVLQLIDEDLQECQAIILVSTQDLAQQISNLTLSLAKKIEAGKGLMKYLAEFLKISILVCDKSVSPDDIETMQILIGTPDIIFKMLKLGALKLSALKILAVDEADRLVPQEETREILESLNENIQVVMASLTMSDDMLMAAKKYTRDPVIIMTKPEELMLGGNRHFYIVVDEKESKSDILVELLQEEVGMAQALIFCNDKESVNEASEVLSRKSFTCSEIDDTMEFRDRDEAIKKFRKGESRFLVTTDILFRGFEIQKVPLIFNYDLPLAKEQYINRLQTCFRLMSGNVINFVMPNEAQRLKELRICYGINFNCFPDPSFFINEYPS